MEPMQATVPMRQTVVAIADEGVRFPFANVSIEVFGMLRAATSESHARDESARPKRRPIAADAIWRRADIDSTSFHRHAECGCATVMKVPA